VPVLFGPKNAGLVSEWSDEDYDVLEDSVVVGRIFKGQRGASGNALDVGIHYAAPALHRNRVLFKLLRRATLVLRLERSLHLHQHQWERWLQAFFTLVLWISVVFMEVASFYALERIACSRLFVHLVLALQLRGFPLELCIGIT
jgi:hypothetical protein